MPPPSPPSRWPTRAGVHRVSVTPPESPTEKDSPMLLLSLTPPVHVQQQSPTSNVIENLMETLEGIPEAFIDGKPSSIPSIVLKARSQWDHSEAKIVSINPRLDVAFVKNQFSAMNTSNPREKAEAALSLSQKLILYVPTSRAMQMLAADQAGMLAWCRVDAGRWAEIPNVSDAFKPLMDGDLGKHPKAIKEIQASLLQLQIEQAQKATTRAKRILQKLLDLIDVLEKP